MITRFQSAQSRSAVCRRLYLFDSLADYRVNLGNIFLDVALGNLKKLSFGFLQEVVDIVALVKSFALD